MNIAITGHRNIDQSLYPCSIIQEACGKILQNFPAYSYTVFSCLAEGADRFLVRHLLSFNDTALTVILPLEETDYIIDFVSDKSRDEYYVLKQLARSIIKVPRVMQRPHAYRLANQYMLDQCQLVFAIWDGKSPRGIGGTAEMIYLARRKQLPIIWITSDQDWRLTDINTERI